jgi:hypothetical protein
MKAVRQAGQRALALKRHKGRRVRNIPTEIKARKARYNFTREDAQMMRELGMQPSHNRRQQLDTTDADNPSNKSLRKPD